MKLRSLRVAALALAAAGLFSTIQPAQAVIVKDEVRVPGDYSGASNIGTGVSNVTANALWAACRADRTLIAQGQGARATNVATFMTSELNGHDAFVVDLGSDKKNIAAKVTGPGAKILVDAERVEEGLYIPNYDFDLQFLSGPAGGAAGVNTGTTPPTVQAPGSGCTGANPGSSTTNAACYSSTPKPDESTTCIKGTADGRGARFIIVSLALNIPVNNAATPAPRTGPVPFTLDYTAS